MYFGFTSPVSVDVGETYVIQLTSTNNTHGWGRTGECVSWIGNHRVDVRISYSTSDFIFQTYSSYPSPANDHPIVDIGGRIPVELENQ